MSRFPSFNTNGELLGNRISKSICFLSRSCASVTLLSFFVSTFLIRICAEWNPLITECHFCHFSPRRTFSNAHENDSLQFNVCVRFDLFYIIIMIASSLFRSFFIFISIFRSSSLKYVFALKFWLLDSFLISSVLFYFFFFFAYVWLYRFVHVFVH